MKTYTATAIVLHWLMALALVGMFALGLYMADLSLSPMKLRLYSWHKWSGVTLFVLACARLAWRLVHRPPPLPAPVSRSEQRLAHAAHGLLYLLMFAIPVSGWLMSSAKGVQTVYLGIVPLPDLLARNKELGDLLQSVHWRLNVVLATLVVAHAAAALKHHFIDHDALLSRMLPRRGGR